MSANDMTQLQTILRDLYCERHKERDKAVRDVNEALVFLSHARQIRDLYQRSLERIAEELAATGYSHAQDYFDRVRPLACPPEDEEKGRQPRTMAESLFTAGILEKCTG